MRQHVVSLTLVSLLMIACIPTYARGMQPVDDPTFELAAPQGFGDRQNSWAWSMQWWRGHLYVGTNRAWECASAASLHAFNPVYEYPPTDPDIACTDDPHDLPLRAEIWRWTPPNTWTRVYQSPEIPIPGVPGKFVGRDVGYRGMTIFQEADGTEALYVGSVTSTFLSYRTPPPRILRSTDGITFEPVPQDPGTVLGDLPWNSLRNPVTYNGRLYIQAGAVLGAGVLLEAADPRAGNDAFRVVSPPSMIVSAMEAYNGALYVGTRDSRNGYAVFKTEATGPLPYVYQNVIEKGGYLPHLPDDEVLTMKVFRDHLYFGTDATGNFLNPSTGAELLRVNPDDTWDVVVGDPRDTPTGRKTPLSGYTAGFGSAFSRHMWRLEVFEGNLYAGTFDSSTLFRNEPDFPQSILGFELYRSSDGSHFDPITTTGFDDKFNFGVRTMAATPYGLFLGTANFYYGLKIYRMPASNHTFKVFIPILQQALSIEGQNAS